MTWKWDEDGLKGSSFEERAFKVGHESLGPRIESIHDHLPIGWARDFYPPVLEARGGGCTDPRMFSADVSGFRRETEFSAIVELLLNGIPCFEEGLAGGLEGPVQGGQELEGIVCEDSCLSLWGSFRKDFNALCNHNNLSVYDERCGLRLRNEELCLGVLYFITPRSEVRPLPSRVTTRLSHACAGGS